MQKPKTIKIFLADGEPTGTKIVEMSNWTGIAYLIPRNRLKNALSNIENKSDLDSQCVYFLIGESEDDNRSVYIGEAEEFSKRINQHNQNKDFWNLVMVFSSKDDNLTKAHVKYLESKVTQVIKNNNTVNLIYGNLPPTPKLPRGDIAEMEEFYEQMKIVSSSLGYTFLEPIKEQNEDVFYCKGPGASAKGLYTDEGLVVLEGSLIRKLTVPSFQLYEKDRSKLLREKSEEFNSNSLRLTSNVLFSNPSWAAAFCLGRSSNGWVEWKNKQGYTLHDLKRV